MNRGLVNVSGTGRPSEIPAGHPLTSCEGGFNVLAPLCLWCGSAIPAHRVKHAMRSKQPARWCRPSCRVQASVARKHARFAANAGGDG
jgi:hypothetical protein